MPAISVPDADAEADRLMKLNSIYKAKSSSGDSSALLWIKLFLSIFL